MAKLLRNDDFVSSVLYDISKSPKQLNQVYRSARPHLSGTHHVGVIRRLRSFVRRTNSPPISGRNVRTSPTLIHSYRRNVISRERAKTSQSNRKSLAVTSSIFDFPADQEIQIPQSYPPKDSIFSESKSPSLAYTSLAQRKSRPRVLVTPNNALERKYKAQTSREMSNLRKGGVAFVVNKSPTFKPVSTEKLKVRGSSKRTVSPLQRQSSIFSSPSVKQKRQKSPSR